MRGLSEDLWYSVESHLPSKAIERPGPEKTHCDAGGRRRAGVEDHWHN